MKLNFLFRCIQRSFIEQFYYLKAVVERVNVYLTEVSIFLEVSSYLVFLFSSKWKISHSS